MQLLLPMQPGRPGSAPSSLSSPRPQIPLVSGAPAAAVSPLQRIPQSSPALLPQQSQQPPVSMASSPPQPTLQSTPTPSALQCMPPPVSLPSGLQQSPPQSASLSMPQLTASPGALASLSQLQSPTGAQVPSPVTLAASAAPPAAADVLSLESASQPESASVPAPASSAAASTPAVSQGMSLAGSQHSLAELHASDATVGGGAVRSTQDAQQQQVGGSLPASAAAPDAGSLTASLLEPEAPEQPVSAALIAASDTSNPVSAAVLGHSLQFSPPQLSQADQKARPSTAPAGSIAAQSSSEQGQASAMDIDGQGMQGSEQTAPSEIAQPQAEPPPGPQAQDTGPGLPASAASAQSAAVQQSLPGVQPTALAAIAGSGSAAGARPEQLPGSAPAVQRPGSLTKPATPMASVAQHWLGGGPASSAARPPSQQGDNLASRCACSQTCCSWCCPALPMFASDRRKVVISTTLCRATAGHACQKMTRLLTTWPCSAGAGQQQGLSALLSGAAPAASVTQGSSAPAPMQLPQVVPPFSSPSLCEGDVHMLGFKLL